MVRFVQKILLDAVRMGASDLHFEPYEFSYRVRFRIDGHLREIASPPPAIKERLASRIKVISRMDISEKRVPQDGRLKLKISRDKTIDLRVSTLPTLFGEKLVIRILDPSTAKLGIDALGYEEAEKQRLLRAIARPDGMILVTGPTGSGKTVSLYTCLNLLNQPGVNIATVEDPTEINMPGVNQVDVNDKAGLTFAAALKSFLRQDPDIIMVGEIRDLVTADIAMKAAQTGHLVLSTLHTNDAPAAVTRLMELDIPAYLIRATLLGVMAQRLLRVLCPHCKQPAQLDDEAWTRLVSPWKARTPTVTYRPVGCQECRNTGFIGRQGIYEILRLDDTVRAAIREDSDSTELRRVAIRGGPHKWRQSPWFRAHFERGRLVQIVANASWPVGASHWYRRSYWLHKMQRQG